MVFVKAPAGFDPESKIPIESRLIFSRCKFCGRKIYPDSPVVITKADPNRNQREYMCMQCLLRLIFTETLEAAARAFSLFSDENTQGIGDEDR